MVDLAVKTCKNDYIIDDKLFPCYTRANDKYNGYCFRCYVHLFPDEPLSRNYKNKESSVCEYINSEFPDLNIICDRVIQFGVSRRRPDMRIHKDTYNIIIEVDENQHNDYEEICENKRLMEIFSDLKNKNLVVIRFNPDDYIDVNYEKVMSCWTYNRQGVVVIKQNKKDEWKQRLNKLKETLDYYLHNAPTKELEIVYLYYDQVKVDDIISESNDIIC